MAFSRESPEEKARLLGTFELTIRAGGLLVSPG